MDNIYDTGVTSRYMDLYNAMKSNKSFFESGITFRHAAIAALALKHNPQNVAQTLKAYAGELKELGSIFNGTNVGEMRHLLAALILKYDDQPDAFMSAFKEARPLFREAKLSLNPFYTVMAVFVLRQNNGQKPLGESHVSRMASVYRAMKKHHRILTGVDDYPFAAFLSTRKGEVETIINRVENIYDSLVEQGFKRRNPLQLASHMLYVSEQTPAELGRRFRKLADTFRRSKIRIFTTDYDELALLSFLKQRPDSITRCVLGIREQLKSLRPRMDSETSFTIASILGFLEMFDHAASAQDMAEVPSIVAAELMLVSHNVATINAHQGAAV